MEFTVVFLEMPNLADWLHKRVCPTLLFLRDHTEVCLNKHKTKLPQIYMREPAPSKKKGSLHKTWQKI